MVWTSSLELQLRKGEFDRAEAHRGTNDRPSGVGSDPQRDKLLIPEACKCDLIWKKDLCTCDYIKNLARGRLPWIIWVGPTCNHSVLLGDRES